MEKKEYHTIGTFLKSNIKINGIQNWYLIIFIHPSIKYIHKEKSYFSYVMEVQVVI
jgi:hypothetical protein